MLPPQIPTSMLPYETDTSDFITAASTSLNINLTIKSPFVLSDLLAKELCNTWIGFYDPKFYATASSSPSIAALSSRKILRLLATTMFVVVCFAFPIDANLVPGNRPG